MLLWTSDKKNKQIYMKKRLDFFKKKFYCTREVCNMENTDSNFVYQWLWSNLRYHGRRHCKHHQAPGESKEGCYHCKSEYAVIIETKRKCEITNSSNSKQKLRGKRGVTPHASQIKLNSTKLNLLKWYIQL